MPLSTVPSHWPISGTLLKMDGIMCVVPTQRGPPRLQELNDTECKYKKVHLFLENQLAGVQLYRES